MCTSLIKKTIPCSTIRSVNGPYSFTLLSPLEDMNTKDSKNRVVFRNSPSYKIRNSQNEFTKATYILETGPLKEKYLCGFL